jgi:NitT/TauT family transport system ATP-binding protein
MTENATLIATAELAVRDLGVRFRRTGQDVWALREVSVSIAPESFTVIVGRSGSGKSTLLRALAGLQPATVGSVDYAGSPVTANREQLRYVFQDYGQSLFPWLSVLGNVRFGSKQGGVPKAHRDEVARDALAKVGLAHVADRKPYELSGGMQQRVAIARALASAPRVILLDEPFGAVDALSRSNLQDTIQKVWAETGTTIVFVTHDIDEAIYLGDRVLVMDPHGNGIALDRTIEIERPRDQEFSRDNPLFNEYRHELLRTVVGDES